MTLQFAGWCWCCWLCCCCAASWVKFSPSFVTVHDTTIYRMMLVLLAVLLLVSQLGEVVGLPPNYEDSDMTLQFAGWCWCCCLCCCWAARWVRWWACPPTTRIATWHYNLQDDVDVVACVAVGQPAGWGGGIAPQLRCALTFASEAKFEIEAKISFLLEAKKKPDFTWFTLQKSEAKTKVK